MENAGKELEAHKGEGKDKVWKKPVKCCRLHGSYIALASLDIKLPAIVAHSVYKLASTAMYPL